MSLVLAIEHTSGVLLASDGFIGSDHLRDVVDRPKYFKLSPHIYVGAVGDSRPAQMAEFGLVYAPRRSREDDMKYLARIISEPLGRRLRKQELKVGSDTSFLVAYNGRAYAILSDLSVMRSAFGYLAIGAGEEVALGALAYTEALSPMDRALTALRAATRHLNHVTEPYFFQEVPKMRKR